MLSISLLHQAYRTRALTPSTYLRQLQARHREIDRGEIWIWRRPEKQLMEDALALDALLASGGTALLEAYPLFGVPFAVKDNIDVQGVPTTAACPAFAYTPERSATAVERLVAAHALFVGKTNLDQFATGLVGTRSPYGAVRNAVNPGYISGGSSSGSAAAVALGLACFALGTDTAGSGRVPAGLNGIVGLKPTRGLVSAAGVLPACRSLDCVSIFATGVADAWRVLKVVAGPSADDAYSRAPAMLAPRQRHLRIGVAGNAEFFGDGAAAEAYRRVLDELESLPSGFSLHTVDMAPLLAAGELLYQGPWVAERRAALGDFFERRPEEMDPVVRATIAAADRYTATDAFAYEYRMADYRRFARGLFEDVDMLVVPTAPIHPRIAEVAADPTGLNRQLGLYTNFVNLLDLAAIAIPATYRNDGLPFGVTLLGPAGSDHRLAAAAAGLSEHFSGIVGNGAQRIAGDPLPFTEKTLDVAVVGAHLGGQPLNWQLIECGARLTSATRTAARYRLYALADTVPPKPGLVRTPEGGAAIEVEVWTLPERAFGGFMAQVGPPLGIGSLELANGQWVKGFICEPLAVQGATDITRHGGWRAYLAARDSAPPEAASILKEATP